MDYIQYISTPKNTPESNPKETIIHLTRGRIVGGWVYFPYGPAGKLHLQIWRSETQIAPANRGESYCLDDAVVPLSIDIWLDEPPYILIAKTWNESTQYDHALSLAIFLQEIPQTGKRKIPGETEKRIEEILKEVKGG